MTHTPGPWEAVGQAVYAQTPQDVDHSRYFGYSERGPHGFLIAESIPHEATARLIAASPDLLAALDGIFTAWYATGDGDSVLAGPAGDVARAAVVKARGE